MWFIRKLRNNCLVFINKPFDEIKVRKEIKQVNSDCGSDDTGNNIQYIMMAGVYGSKPNAQHYHNEHDVNPL